MFKPTKKEIGQYKTTLVRCSREAAFAVSCFTGGLISLVMLPAPKDFPWVFKMGAGLSIGGLSFLAGTVSREKLWFTSEEEKQLSASPPPTPDPVTPVQPQASYTSSYEPEPEPYPIPTYKPERADRVVEKLKRVKEPVENTFDLNEWESDLGLGIELEAKPKSRIDRPRKEARPRPRPTLEDLGLTEKDLIAETSTLPVRRKPSLKPEARSQQLAATNEPSLWDAL